MQPIGGYGSLGIARLTDLADALLAHMTAPIGADESVYGSGQGVRTRGVCVVCVGQLKQIKDIRVDLIYAMDTDMDLQLALFTLPSVTNCPATDIDPSDMSARHLLSTEVYIYFDSIPYGPAQKFNCEGGWWMRLLHPPPWHFWESFECQFRKLQRFAKGHKKKQMGRRSAAQGLHRIFIARIKPSG